jgi:hypothetical protein
LNVAVLCQFQQAQNKQKLEEAMNVTVLCQFQQAQNKQNLEEATTQINNRHGSEPTVHFILVICLH